MYLFRSGLFEHLNNVRTGCSSYNRIIYHNNTFSLYNLFDHVQLDLHTAFPLTLFWLDKCSSDITVLVECHAIRNSRLFRISFRRNQPGIRYSDNQIRINRIRFCQSFPCNNSRMIYIHIIDHAVHSCEIYIFKNTSCLLFGIDCHSFI